MTWERAGAFAGILILAAFAYLELSLLTRDILLRRIAQSLVDQAMNAEVDEIAAISLAPSGALVLHRPRIITRHGDQALTLFEAESITFSLNGNASSILERGLASLEEIRMLRVDIQAPHLYFARGFDGRWNMDLAFGPRPVRKLPTPRAPAPPSAPLAPPPPPPDLFPPEGIHVHRCTLHVQFHNPRQDLLEWVLQDMDFVVRKSPQRQLLIQNPDGREDIEARFYGGTFVFWLKVTGLNRGMEADMQLRVKDARLEQLTQGLKLPRPVSGNLNVTLSLARSFDETDGRIAGAGRAWVTDGDLYEYPMIVRAIGILNLSVPQESKIDSADLAFKVRKYLIEITEMNFYSDAVSLLGDGVCDLFGQDMDVVFVPRLGRTGSLNPFNLLFSQLLTAHLEGPVVAPTARVVPFASYKESEHRIIEQAIQRERK